jgi:tRNA (guanine37-N1)-methyltransferase
VGYTAARQDRPWAPGDPLAPAAWFEVATADGNIAATGPDLARLVRLLLGRGEVDGSRVVAESVIEAMVTSLAPDGEPFGQAAAADLAQARHLILVCGRYEGVDDRVREHVDRVLSLGDFILMGGEAAAWAVVEAVVRLVPGVVEARSLAEESFGDGLLEAPQYTRPHRLRWRGGEQAVPDVVRAGDHGRERLARRRAALCRTLIRRPDLLRGYAALSGDSALWGDVLVAAATWGGRAVDWSDRMLY